MSSDEQLVEFASAIVGGLLVLWWYMRIAHSAQSDRAFLEFVWLALAPIAATLGVFVVIKTAGSFDVRKAPDYILLYCLLGLAWFFAATYALEYFGISFRDDAVERRNPAAALVIIGAMFAHAAIYAGGNIGNGPGWWTVVIAAGLGSLVWFVLWGIVEFVCKLSDDVTVERDVPAGIRLAGYALAMGLICARGAAGDWTSLHQTLVEFVVAWPVLPLTTAVIAIEKILDGQPEHYRRGYAVSCLVAALYLAAAAGTVALSGPLPHNPQYDNASANWSSS